MVTKTSPSAMHISNQKPLIEFNHLPALGDSSIVSWNYNNDKNTEHVTNAIIFAF